MRRYSNQLMIDAATAPTVSPVYVNSRCDACSVQVRGTFTSATLFLQGKIDPDTDVWVNIGAIDLSDFTTDTDGITNTKLYEFGIEGAAYVRINVTEVSGGSISAYVSFFSTTAN